VVHPADIQDRDGAGLVIAAVHNLFPWLRHLFADSAYAGDKLLNRLAEFGHWTIELVKCPAATAGFNRCRAVGWSNGDWLGSIATAAWQRTSRHRSPVLPPGFTLLLCNSSSAALHRYNHYDSESDTKTEHTRRD
jgi:hypothetical protein